MSMAQKTNTDSLCDSFLNSFSNQEHQRIIAALFSDSNTFDKKMYKILYTILVMKMKEDILAKVKQLKKKSENYPHSRTTLNLVLQGLQTFLSEDKIPPYQMAFFKKIEYQLVLANKLECIDWNNHEIEGFSPVDEVLICMNYNNSTYMKILECWLSERINTSSGIAEQLQQVYYYRKVFSQLHSNQEFSLNQNYPPLSQVIGNWLLHETKYWENRLNLWVRVREVRQEDESSAKKNRPQERIQWSLSADQIALILRAADQSRIILAKSMSAVFKMVVPHIQTPYRDSLSHSATRTGAYHAEQTDKDKAINALQKMIECIKGY